MTYITHDDRAEFAASIRQRLSDLIARLSLRRTQNRAYRSTVNELLTLSNRELIDMGIDRADIARQAAYGR